MSVRQEFIWEWPEGVTPITFHQWVRTKLTNEEKEEFYTAERNQLAFREKAIAEGNLIVQSNSVYVWKDESAFKVNKPYDDVWYIYFNRYIKETGVKFSAKIHKKNVQSAL